MKKILFGFQNPFICIQKKKYFINLNKYFDITLFTTNNFLTKKVKDELNALKKNKIVKDVIILNKFSSKRNKISLIKLFISYQSLKKKINKLKQENFVACILDANFHSWQRILSEIVIKDDCKLIIYNHDFLALHMDALEKFYNGENVHKILDSVHKLREIHGTKIKKSFFQKILSVSHWFNYIDYKKDIIDRKYFARFFFNKEFNYRSLDLNTAMDSSNPRINIILTYFENSKLFWKKVYPEIEVLKIKNSNKKCDCLNNEKKKNKILYTSSLAPEFNENIQQSRRENLLRDTKTILMNLENVNEIHYRPHPAEKEEIINYFFQYLKDNLINRAKVILVDNNENLAEISCNYKLVYGLLGTSLNTINQSCKEVVVIGLSSMSKDDLGINCRIKFKNTGINLIENDGEYKKNTFVKENLESSTILTLDEYLKKLNN